MKNILFILLLCSILFITSVNATLPLSGKLIIIDPGHGDIDIGTNYNNIKESDLNMQISKELEQELIKNGASVLLTRDGNYDLSSPNTKKRKKSDFDNRINLINNSKANLYLSIHINYLDNKSYYGSQVFYTNEDNKKLAIKIQENLNKITYPRNIKKINNLYMYDKLKIKGVLIECGFISSDIERNNLIKKDYQIKLAKEITNGVINYYNN